MKRLVMMMLSVLLSGGMLMCSSGQKNSDQSGENKSRETEKQAQKPKLNRLWKTDTVLRVPESVFYNKKRDVLYASNIGGNPTKKDGTGFISKISTKGEVVKKEWVTGLNAPKGMGVYQGKLYVTDIDEVVRINIKEGKVEQRFPLVGAEFANDIAINARGTVFISDMRANKVYKLDEEAPTVWLDDPALKSPNGLYTEDKVLLIGITGKVLKANYKTKEITEYITNTGGIDGLEKVEGELYAVSDWKGHVHLVHPEKDKVLILDTTADNINAADIDFDKENLRLYVPTFHDNRVMAYKLKL